MSSDASRSPRITSLAWGRIEIEGFDEPFKDAKLYPGGARAWDWTETGTRHHPGIQASDVHELVERGATVVVLSQGVYERLGVCPDAFRLLEDHGVEIHVLPTDDAVRRYNELAATERVGGLIHSTC